MGDTPRGDGAWIEKGRASQHLKQDDHPWAIKGAGEEGPDFFGWNRSRHLRPVLGVEMIALHLMILGLLFAL